MFRPQLKGYLLCDVKKASLNVATSLAGPRHALVADFSLRGRLDVLGLSELLDVRGLTESMAWRNYRSEFAAGIAVHQPVGKPLHLRDFAVARSAFTFFEVPTVDRVRWLQGLGSGVEVFGWGTAEDRFVREVSEGGGMVIPSDWALNLSALQHLPMPLPARPRRAEPKPLTSGERLVAFVVTDGDNLQWLLNGFVESPGFWASAQRGRFPVTWELAPILARLAPRVGARLFRSATTNDDFIAGPSGAGYYFPSDAPDAAGLARISGQAMSDAQLEIATVLNRGGAMDAADPLLGRPEIAAVFYKDYSPYNKYRGVVRWSAGKPIISYRYLLWEQKRADGTLRPDWLPEGVAAAVAALPADSDRIEERCALINVHAWSFGNSGGPMSAIARTIALLPSGTRVVTGSELVAVLGHQK